MPQERLSVLYNFSFLTTQKQFMSHCTLGSKFSSWDFHIQSNELIRSLLYIITNCIRCIPQPTTNFTRNFNKCFKLFHYYYNNNTGSSEEVVDPTEKQKIQSVVDKRDARNGGTVWKGTLLKCMCTDKDRWREQHCGRSSHNRRRC